MLAGCRPVGALGALPCRRGIGIMNVPPGHKGVHILGWRLRSLPLRCDLNRRDRP